MEIIGQIENQYKTPVFKIYLSSAGSRTNDYHNHKHNDIEICCILEGHGLYRTQNKVYDICDRDIFLFAPNERHCITDIYGNLNQTMYVLNLHFSPTFIWSMGNDDFLKNSYMDIFYSRPKNFSNRLDRENPSKEKIFHLIDDIKKEFSLKQNDYSIMVKSRLIEILIVLRRDFISPLADTENNSGSLHFAQVQKAINYINKNFCLPVTLDEIAQQAYMPKTYFCSVFKQLNGLTPWQYINIKRIEKSMELLKKSNSTILDIASRCGYNNTANFNKIFKSVTGVTPKYFKNKK